MFDRLAPQAPRVPSGAWALPPIGSLAPFHVPAEKLLVSLRDIADGAREASRLVDASRPDGDVYREVERAAIAARDPQPLADLLRGDPDRVAAAVVLCRTAIARQDEVREKGAPALAKAVEKIDEALAELGDRFMVTAVRSWQRRGTGVGLAAIEDADSIIEEGRKLAALKVWCQGERAYDPAGRSPGWSLTAHGALYAAKVARGVADGVVPVSGHPDWFTKHAPADFRAWESEAGRRHLAQAR